MKAIYRILTLILLIPTIFILFMLGGVSLMEGYNIFEPYIDTEFGENYTPEKFDLINKDFTKEDVLKTVGQPLFIHNDTLTNETQFTYTNDGFLRRKSNRNYDIGDFAWYRSSIYFDSTGKINRIDKGWSYD
jgi:outer membrane protein assembly factor BamE (lipoprotein component of BamABCDE complex)